MAEARRRLILGNGEQYIQSVEKRGFGRTPDFPRTYEAARDVVRRGASEALRRIRELPSTKRLPDESVFCLRLHPDVTAKSYDPDALFAAVPDLRKVGSRYYNESLENVVETKRTKKLKTTQSGTEGRLVFVQSSEDGIGRFIRYLDRGEGQVGRLFREALRRVERFDTLRPDEQVMGFDDSWESGRAELVFHPTRLEPGEQMEFFTTLFEDVGIGVDAIQPRLYPGGPTFVSCKLDREALEALRETNPLRAVHPLEFSGLSDLRSAMTDKAPKRPLSTTRSTIKVGMFDGGTDVTSILLQGYVEEDTNLAIASAPESVGIAHGTAVAGALLYGPLNDLGPTAHLPAPPVSVVSIRALPTLNRQDKDLYEAIDVIENAVPARNDIKVFNVSFGPKGPIIDDRISRFTYVLDSLSVTHKVTFFVAVGNDAETPGLERIQAPADLVHGVGVGAYTFHGNNKIIAPYSCRGPGRECGKIKPDLAALGGCSQRPIHLVSSRNGLKVMSRGTSFSSPLAARMGALASESFERSSSLLGKALLIHSAKHPLGDPDHVFGHGCIPDEIDDVLSCDAGVVTVVYQGAILPTKIVKVPVPLPSTITIPGKVRVTWTVACLPPIEPNHPGDYTAACLEDTFYPDSNIYKFTTPKTAKKKQELKLHIEEDESQIQALLSKGWTKSLFPVPESHNSYRDEQSRRALDCKWEPTVRRTASKFSAGLSSPFLTLQAIGRHGMNERFDYVVVISVEAPKYRGDLYADVRSSFPALNPIRLRTEAELRIQL